MTFNLLVVDDEQSLGALLVAYLQPKGFRVLFTDNGRDGLKLAYNEHPDVVILDIVMPGFNGWQVCERLRELSDVPIIFLSALGSEDDVVKSFELGADDYIQKPFRLAELERRIRAVIRRVQSHEGATTARYDDGELRLDLERQQVWRHGTAVHLSATEFNLLNSLIRRRGSVVTHKELLVEVWGPGYANSVSCLSLYIRYLRAKLEDHPSEPKYILTKWGVGYWFEPHEFADAAPHSLPNENGSI